MVSAVDELAVRLEQLDRRRHAMPARLELARDESTGDWVALIMADPLPVPLAARGSAPLDALAELVDECERLDWRTVPR